ncbi:hypothetical protein G5I_00588 [Acromyrmex echinatior]|uniref:DUF4817 domain-containing protein n=1 Tax=Acromyrmex echinatior TaxID=103372 RepID=F4W593_ACREC|nr:hypothetical protein G5I_00588 [Acromyrmex echinatior]
MATPNELQTRNFDSLLVIPSAARNNMFSLEERFEILKTYFQSQCCVAETVRILKRNMGRDRAPTEGAIRKLVRKVREKGMLVDDRSGPRARTVRTPENIEAVAQSRPTTPAILTDTALPDCEERKKRTAKNGSRVTTAADGSAGAHDTRLQVARRHKADRELGWQDEDGHSTPPKDGESLEQAPRGHEARKDPAASRISRARTCDTSMTRFPRLAKPRAKHDKAPSG